MNSLTNLLDSDGECNDILGNIYSLFPHNVMDYVQKCYKKIVGPLAFLIVKNLKAKFTQINLLLGNFCRIPVHSIDQYKFSNPRFTATSGHF